MKNEKNIKQMLEILAEETGESVEVLRKCYDDDVIGLFEDGERLLHMLAADQMKGTITVINLYDWGWALDMRERY